MFGERVFQQTVRSPTATNYATLLADFGPLLALHRLGAGASPQKPVYASPVL